MQPIKSREKDHSDYLTEFTNTQTIKIGIILIILRFEQNTQARAFMWNNPCQMTMYPGCAGLTPHLTLKGGELVWVSSALHASWEFLFPVLCRDPCPLKLQLLFDVLLFTLLKEHGVLVAGGWQKVQYLFYRINVASYHFDGDYMVLKLLWLCWQPLRRSARVIERVGKPM